MSLEHSARRIRESSIQPRHSLDHLLLHLWEDLLSASGIEFADTFRDSGGNSELEEVLVKRLEQVSGIRSIKLPLPANLTIRALADDLLQRLPMLPIQEIAVGVSVFLYQ
jgi:hypothetical protein